MVQGRRAEDCRVTTTPPVPLTLVVGEEELLVSRAVSAVVRAAREADADTEKRAVVKLCCPRRAVRRTAGGRRQDARYPRSTGFSGGPESVESPLV